MDAKTVFLFFVLHRLYIQALPVKNEVENSSCIQVTKERVKELHEIGEEVNNFINELSDKHEDIDFTFVELKVENHADDEDEEKETTLKITVNDCNNKAKNHPKNEDTYFENDDVHGNKEGINKDNIEESGNNKTEAINNKNIEESTNSKNGKIDVNETSDTKPQNENRKSETINVNKTSKSESFDEENIKKSEEESTKISKNLPKIERSELDTERKELSGETEIVKNEEERAIVNSKDEPKNEKINKMKHPNQSTESDGINNSDRDRAENKHTNINENIGNNNIVIYAPSIESTAIEIGSDYQSYANMQNVLRKLTDRRQTRIPISNPTKFYEIPIDNFDYSNDQPNYDYDSYTDTDDVFRSNVVGRQKTNGQVNPENETQQLNTFEFGRNEFDLGARFNSGDWLQ